MLPPSMLAAMFKKRPLSEDMTDNGRNKREGVEENSKEYEITDNGNTTMKVIVRIRPENESEIRSNCETIVRQLDKHVLVFDPKQDNMPQFRDGEGGVRGGARKRRPFLSKKRKDLRFAFDRVFDETSSQQEVFETTTRPILEGLLDGVNCSVFAYGATGAGKTYTMLGSEEEPGIMFLTTMELYRRIECLKSEKICDVAVTYLEIYNETIKDLLVPSGPLAMREDGQCGLVVSGLSRHQPKSAEELLKMLADGNKNRTQHPTDANATSSRSHAVFQVYVNQRARSGGLTAEVTQGKLSLIDLAGSERATVTTNRGARMREGANINKSLLALGNCINALAANKSKSCHVPYRNSKLTRLLKDSLGGNCRTVMIANVSPSGLTYEDTHNTLRYADRAKQIKTKLVRNVVNVDYHITRYRTIVIELQKEIVELKSQLKTPSLTSSIYSMDEQTEKIKEDIQKVYSDRTNLRKSMAEFDATERDTLLSIFRKEKDLERVEVLTGNDEKIAKIKSKLNYLLARLRDVQEKKTTLHCQLSINNENIDQLRTKINQSNFSEDLTKYIEAVTEVSKLDTECSYQWKQTKHLLRYIKNQEKEISRTEKFFLLALELVRKQHQLLQATNCLTPVVRDLFRSLTRQIEGEKEVAWSNSATDDSLCNVSVSSFTATHQTLFDTIVSHNSPLKKSSTHPSVGSRYSSPISSASLGILTTGNVETQCNNGEKERGRGKGREGGGGGGGEVKKTGHPLSERRVATPADERKPLTVNNNCKVLSAPVTSPTKKKRASFSPSPVQTEDSDVEKKSTGITKKMVEKKMVEKKKGSSSSLSGLKKGGGGGQINLAQLTSISKPYSPPPTPSSTRLSSSPLPSRPSAPPPIPPPPVANCFEDDFVSRGPDSSTVAPGNRDATPTQQDQLYILGQLRQSLPKKPTPLNLTKLPVSSSYPLPPISLSSIPPIPFPPPPAAADYFKDRRVESSVAPGNRETTPTQNRPYVFTTSGRKLPLPRTTPTGFNKGSTGPFNYPQALPSFLSPSINPYPPPLGNTSSLSNSLTPPTNCVASLTYNETPPPNSHPVKHPTADNYVSNPLYMKNLPRQQRREERYFPEEDLNTTFIVSKETTAARRERELGKSYPIAVPNKMCLNNSSQGGGARMGGVRGVRKNKKSPLKVPVRPLDDLTSSNEYNKSDGGGGAATETTDRSSQPPRYLSLTKSAANKRQTFTRPSTKENRQPIPFTRSISNRHW